MRFGRTGHVFPDFRLRRQPVCCRLILRCKESFFRPGAIVGGYGQRRWSGLHGLAGIDRARTPRQPHGSPRYRLVTTAQFCTDGHQTDKAGRRRHERILQTVGGTGLIIQCNSPLTFPRDNSSVQFRAGSKTAEHDRRTGRGVGHLDCKGQRRIRTLRSRRQQQASVKQSL